MLTLPFPRDASSYVDSNVGKILAFIYGKKEFSNTIVILWSDHGFSLGEKTIWGKHHLYQIALLSPLIIRLPGQRTPGQDSSAVVETIDIYPTLCELCSIPLPKHLVGTSLKPILDDPSAQSDGIARSFWAGKKSVITHDTHTIFSKGKPWLRFNLTDDPHEEKNLLDTKP